MKPTLDAILMSNNNFDLSEHLPTRKSRWKIRPPPPPRGQVRVEGRAARGEARLRGECDSAEEGKLDTSISPEEEKETQLRREKDERGRRK